MNVRESARLSNLATSIEQEAILLRDNLVHYAVLGSLKHREEALRRIGTLQEALVEVEEQVKGTEQSFNGGFSMEDDDLRKAVSRFEDAVNRLANNAKPLEVFAKPEPFQPEDTQDKMISFKVQGLLLDSVEFLCGKCKSHYWRNIVVPALSVVEWEPNKHRCESVS